MCTPNCFAASFIGRQLCVCQVLQHPNCVPTFFFAADYGVTNTSGAKIFVSQYWQPRLVGALLQTSSDGLKKSRIRETPTLSTDADSRTDTNMKRLRDLSYFFIFFCFFFF